MKNKKIVAGIAGVILLGGGFLGGYVYGKSSVPTRGQFMMGQNGAQFGNRGMMGARSGGFTAGEIIAKDASGITIKMQDGSTKIVLIGASAQVMKNATGTTEDLHTGTSVTVIGTTNSDGSVTAQSVQIRPMGMMGSTTLRQ